MLKYSIERQELDENGFTVIDQLFSNDEVEKIIQTINQIDSSNPTFRKTNDLFAIRQCLKEIPALKKLLFTESVTQVIKHFFGENYFVVKSIYFDKPEHSNWFVAYHQDLTISVDR